MGEDRRVPAVAALVAVRLNWGSGLAKRDLTREPVRKLVGGYRPGTAGKRVGGESGVREFLRGGSHQGLPFGRRKGAAAFVAAEID